MCWEDNLRGKVRLRFAMSKIIDFPPRPISDPKKCQHQSTLDKIPIAPQRTQLPPITPPKSANLDPNMKLLTLNFLTCARKACKTHPTSFPLHPKDAELEIVEIDFNPLFLRNILPRLEWQALKQMCNELSLPGLKDEPPEPEELYLSTQEGPETENAKRESEGMEVSDAEQEKEAEDGKEPSQLARDLHRLLMETCIQEGKLVCGNCGHEYAVKEGIANFLLPSHLV